LRGKTALRRERLHFARCAFSGGREGSEGTGGYGQYAVDFETESSGRGFEMVASNYCSKAQPQAKGLPQASPGQSESASGALGTP